MYILLKAFLTASIGLMIRLVISFIWPNDNSNQHSGLWWGSYFLGSIIGLLLYSFIFKREKN
jgi:cytosine/uracil/thiamine/allantoin permease